MRRSNERMRASEQEWKRQLKRMTMLRNKREVGRGAEGTFFEECLTARSFRGFSGYVGSFEVMLRDFKEFCQKLVGFSKF